MSNNINLTAGMRSNLSSLQNLNKALQTTQTRLSTGKKVNSALDDPATFYQASALNQRVSALDRLLDAMGQSMQTIATANLGVESSIKVLEQMKQTAQQAASLELLPETRPVETNTAATEAGMTIALRSAPVATTGAVEATTAPQTEWVFEVGLAHDGKGNTAALVEQYGDSAQAASWCNQFYAPGVSKSDENFGAGQWYLPAVGELIDAYGEIEPIYQSGIAKVEIVDGHREWNVATKEDFLQNVDNYFILEARDRTNGHETYSILDKQGYEEFIYAHGSVSYTENNIRYDLQTGYFVSEYGTFDPPEQGIIDQEEYDADVYFSRTRNAGGLEIYTILTPEEYQNLVLEYGVDGGGGGFYYDNDTAIEFGHAYRLDYQLNKSDNYYAISNALQIINEVDGIGDNYDFSSNGDGLWTSSVGNLSCSWVLENGNIENIYYNAYQDSYNGRQVRPFTLLENKFNDAEVKPEVGNIMYADLSCSSAEDYQANLEAGKTAVGVVTWVSDDGASARVMGLHLLSGIWDSDINDHVFDPDDPYDNSHNKDNRVNFYNTQQWHQNIEDIADISDWQEVYFCGDEAEQSAMFNGKTNTLALIEQYGEGATVASACNAFYAPGVDADDENFGQGTWYLPAIGELMQATGEYEITDCREKIFYCTTPNVKYYQLGLEDLAWNEITEQQYEQLKKEEYYIKTWYSYDGETGYEEETSQRITKDEYDAFIAEYGSNEFFNEDYMRRIWVRPGLNVELSMEANEITLDECIEVKDNYYYMQTYTSFGDDYLDTYWTEMITKDEYDAFIVKHGGNETSGGNTFVTNACTSYWSGENSISIGDYANIKDDYYLIEVDSIPNRISKEEYWKLYDQHGGVYWQEPGRYFEIFHVGSISANVVDSSKVNAISEAINYLGASLDDIYGLYDWDNYCTSSEVAKSQMYTMNGGIPVVADENSQQYTRAFNLLKDQFGNNETKPVVGDVMYSDLSYGSADDYDRAKTAVGVVVWVSDDGASAKIMSMVELRFKSTERVVKPYKFDPDDPGNGEKVQSFNSKYLNYVSAFNPPVEQIATSNLFTIYNSSNPGSMVEVPIEPEPEPEPEPTPATQSSAVAAMQQQFVKINNEFNAIMADSAYNGIGLLKGQNMTVKLNEKAQDNMVIKGFAAANYAIDTDWQSQADIQATIAQIEWTMAALQAYAQELSNAEQIMQIRQNFNDAMRDILQVGSDNLVLADMNEETANYLAMQTRQQLAVNALALAAQSDQSILKLFN